ncbi:glycosyltransferase family 2 protein [Fulvimonas yonginensis]|uniref:Glycosyltransferase family 2 protein n=1 Tax=Fulvimonas yonginensis TaxID=1495200 RepID=A0ABU8J8V2_9GAMM
MSVVVPCYRCVDTIGPAVASIAGQRLPPAEVLLVDDCSCDGTLERLHEIARSYPDGWVRVLALPRNGGPSGARNLGWSHARQPYIAFLDADDTWHPEKLSIQMEVLESDPSIALLAHRMNVQPRSAPAPAVRHPPPVTVVRPSLLQMRSPFPTASLVLRRDLPFRFDESRRRAEDYLLWAQILLNGYRCARVELVLASWHKPAFGAGGLSGDLAAMHEAATEVRRQLHAQGLVGGLQMRVVQVLSELRYLRRRVITYTRRFFQNTQSPRADQAG